MAAHGRLCTRLDDMRYLGVFLPVGMLGFCRKNGLPSLSFHAVSLMGHSCCSLLRLSSYQQISNNVEFGGM